MYLVRRIAAQMLTATSVVLACVSCEQGPSSTRGTRARIAVPATIRPVDLTCEYLVEPLGIDVAGPRLSWKLAAVDDDHRGLAQRAYHVLVASDRTILAQDRADLWDSGVVESDRSVLVAYEGAALKSRMPCFWKVRVRDHLNRWSGWSEPTRWTMGLLDADDWTGQWIGADKVYQRKPGWPPPDNDVPDPWLRKTFTLAAEPGAAFICVASIGYHELYVNGRRIGNAVLSPAATNHRKRARYVTYEITDALQSGKNVIALWLGVSWSIFPHYKTDDRPKTPMVIARADITMANGQTATIVTDGTWKTHPSPNTLLGIWDFMHFGGELYDANKEMPDWCTVDLDDSDWAAVTVYEPNLILSAERVEPNRRIKRVSPTTIEDAGQGKYRVDLGVNMVGYLEADVEGPPGTVVEFKFSERPGEEMTHRLHSRYVIGPSGKGTFRSRFNYFSGRWILIEGLARAPRPQEIRCDMVRTDYDRTGRFECSNELLNNIYDTVLWTFENLSLGAYVVDCPQRERMGYGGDAHATTDCGLTHYRLGAFYTKWIEDWRDCQSPDGNLPYTAPTYWGGGGPAWSGYCITLPAKVYERYGDVRILQENFPMMQRWLAFLESHAKNDMLVRWGGEWDFLGDWLWPGAKGVNGDTRETLFFNNCYWVYNLQTAASIAEVLGKSDAVAQYRQRADQVRKAVHAEFFDPNEKTYVNSFQGYLATALLAGVPPEDVRTAIIQRLEDEILIKRNGHVHAGITAGYFLTEMLLNLDRQDLLFTMANQRDYPGWGDMLAKGATTFWESWDGDNSLLHSSYLWIGPWFIEGLGGIKVDPSHPGMQHFIIKPGIVDHESLTWVNASHESLYGPIESRWRIDGTAFHLDVVIPPNTTATLYLPADSIDGITESQEAVVYTEGLKNFGRGLGQVILDLASGRYSFESQYTHNKWIAGSNP